MVGWNVICEKRKINFDEEVFGDFLEEKDFHLGTQGIPRVSFDLNGQCDRRGARSHENHEYQTDVVFPYK